MAAQQLREEFFVDRDLATLQGVQLGFVVIYDDDLMPKVGETGARDQAYVSRTNHRNAHVSDSWELAGSHAGVSRK
jgi:hypothetical protein